VLRHANHSPGHINLLRIEENLSAAWQRLSGTYVENLLWLECAERYDRAHTFDYMDPPYWQIAGYGVDFPFESYERMADFTQAYALEGAAMT
jgi:DNA adenine methylase